MQPYYQDDWATIYHGDCREVLPSLDPCDTCITDPPYGLEFMGKDWDKGVPGVHFWELIRAALKPGALCLSFGGTRTYHRLTCAIEDAGFEVRDCLMWLYGSGFPKSLDISKAIDKGAGAEREVVGKHPDPRHNYPNTDITGGRYIGGEPAKRESGILTAPATDAAKLWDGWGTALKPAWEPIVLAMNPLDGTFADNAQRHGVAGLNIDGARTGTEKPYRENTDGKEGIFGLGSRKAIGTIQEGRWPANVVLDEDAAAMLDQQSEPKMHGAGYAVQSKFPPGANGHTYHFGGTGDRHGDSGGASRFFYTAKASRAERGENNDHPTVKPFDLIAWLCNLTRTPTGGAVLDPFMGSGTTLWAAKETGRKSVGIEIEERYCEIAAQRLSQEVLAL